MSSEKYLAGLSFPSMKQVLKISNLSQPRIHSFPCSHHPMSRCPSICLLSTWGEGRTPVSQALGSLLHLYPSLKASALPRTQLCLLSPLQVEGGSAWLSYASLQPKLTCLKSNTSSPPPPKPSQLNSSQDSWVTPPSPLNPIPNFLLI